MPNPDKTLVNGFLQSEYGLGDMARTLRLVTSRSGKRPNTFTQEIGKLQPGRLYTFRMIACDFQDLSTREKPAFNIRFERAAVDADKSFSAVFPDEPFIDPDQHNTWLTYYWCVFRAESERVRVTVSDWISEDAVIHHALTIHRTDANNSERERRALVCNYVSKCWSASV